MVQSKNNQSRRALAAERLRNSSRTDPKRVHIISRGEKWILKRVDIDKILNLVKTKKEAIALAKSYLKMGEINKIVVHKKDGTVQKVL